MDCTSARLLLIFRRPGELDAAERETLDQHLEGCPDCAAHFHQEARVDQAVCTAMRAVPVPAPLRGQILGELARRRRPYPWPWAAAAACILLALGLGLYAWTQSKPVFDPEEFFHIASKATDPDQVEGWFADQGMVMVAPRQFNFAYLDSYDTQTVQGRPVPHLLFHLRGNGGPAIAHVYVLSTKTFKIGDLPDEISRSNHNIRFLRDPDGQFLYAVVYTGGTLIPFFRLRDDV
jgi:hypothetical protein